MAIKINLENKVTIPVDFGGLEFNVTLGDEGQDKLIDLMQNFEKKQQTVKNKERDLLNDSDVEVMKLGLKKVREQQKEIAQEGYDQLFGEGSFGKIYDKYPDVLVLVSEFPSTCEVITNEKLKQVEQTQKDKAAQYINQKKNKNKNKNKNRNR